MSDSTLAAISESPSANESRIRSAKRKLDDAFQIIDNAVARGKGRDASERPPSTEESEYDTFALLNAEEVWYPSKRDNKFKVKHLVLRVEALADNLLEQPLLLFRQESTLLI
ncbi:hypothetical protein NLJ89_g1476 [Agrocybe chaxingu]|uniref:Uncharacterized protein n=1 Tax=Agrocybe chaxingu TaxID=84603 RepID=A0A9W8N006_9AGAR|nr:hypothetical protein NLJ89_g1476 [Agrocybe chaxingu]